MKGYQPGVERLKLPGRLQQQRGCVVAAAIRKRDLLAQCDLAAQQVRSGMLELIRRPGLRAGQQP